MSRSRKKPGDHGARAVDRIVVYREASGVFSAYIAGVPVYTQATTARQAERAIRRTLTAYREAHPRRMDTR